MPPEPRPIDRADLTERLDQVARATRFSGVVGVSDARVPRLTRAYGIADRRTGRPMTVDTRLAIASGTKTFTASAVMRLVEAGRLTLDAPVRPWLGSDLPDIDAAVTIEHLLTHTSGIGDYFDESTTDTEEFVLPVDPATLVDTEDWLPVLAGHPAVDPPGTRFAYNNSGYVVLALVAERVAGRPYRELVAGVCGRAGMTGTAFHRNDDPAHDLATGYLNDGSTNAALMPRYGGGDGGLSSTLDDIERFWAAFLGGRIVGPDTVTSMTTRRTTLPSGWGYGLGCWLSPKGTAVQLEGCDAGISFRSVGLRTSDRSWTVMSNTTDGAFPVAQVLDRLLGREG